MTINPTSGMITWSPSSDQEGYHTVTAEVTDGIETSVVMFDIEVLPAESEGMNMGLIIGIVVAILIIIGIVVFFVFFRKREKEEEVDKEAEEIRKQAEEHLHELEWEHEHYTHHEEGPGTVVTTAAEAHAHDHDHIDYDKEDLYGQKEPELDDGEAPEEDEEAVDLDSLIAGAEKTHSEIVVRGDDSIPEDRELKAVEDPYDHYGENEEDIEK